MAIGSTALTSNPSDNQNLIFWSSSLRYLDMNASNGGVARGTAISTAWVDIFNFSGSGFLAGFVVNLETFTDWKLRLIVDSQELFGAAGMTTDDLTTDQIYDLDQEADVNAGSLGLSKGAHDRFIFKSPLNIRIKFTSSLVIKLARVSGSKNFRAGLVILG